MRRDVLFFSSILFLFWHIEKEEEKKNVNKQIKQNSLNYIGESIQKSWKSIILSMFGFLWFFLGRLTMATATGIAIDFFL